LIEGSGYVQAQIPYLWIRILEAQKYTDPTDPDPQHWCKGNLTLYEFNFKIKIGCGS
jgi:hypothetical protein